MADLFRYQFPYWKKFWKGYSQCGCGYFRECLIHCGDGHDTGKCYGRATVCSESVTDEV